MLIDCFREKLLTASCCDRAEGGLIEIPNSVREKELKNNQLCPLFRGKGSHLKTCDGILLLAKNNRFHAVFCELKTSWNADAIKQIRNSHLFFNYAHAVVKEWHGAPAEAVSTWFAVLTTGVLPVMKFGTRFRSSAIPPTHKPSRNVLEPRRLLLSCGKGQSAKNPLLVRELANL